MKANHWLIVLVVLLLIIMSGQTWFLWKVHTEHRSERGSADMYRPVSSRSSAAFSPTSRASISPQFQRSFGRADDAWDPFREMDDMQSMMNRMFRDSFNRGMMTQGLSGAQISSYNPDIDILSKDDEYIVTVDLPGIEKDKIDVKVKNGQLILSGQREAQKETEEDSGFYQMERSFGSFHRSFPLPEDASSEGIKAESKNGVLTIHIPRVKDAQKAGSNITIE